MIKLVTGSNESYFPRMAGYLSDLREFCTVPAFYVAVGWEAPELDGVEAVSISHEDNAGAPNRTMCIQHGSFVEHVPARADTVLVYTDGDFRMQRPLDDDELALLDLSHGQVVTSWNGGPTETLQLEAGRLSIRHGANVEAWGHTDKPIYNVGFLAMTKKTWQDVYNLYMSKWEDVCGVFAHMARQQWLISWAIHELALDVTIAPWSLHAHGHFGLKPGMTRGGDGLIYHEGKLAAFRHFL